MATSTINLLINLLETNDFTAISKLSLLINDYYRESFNN